MRPMHILPYLHAAVALFWVLAIQKVALYALLEHLGRLDDDPAAEDHVLETFSMPVEGAEAPLFTAFLILISRRLPAAGRRAGVPVGRRR